MRSGFPASECATPRNPDKTVEYNYAKLVSTIMREGFHLLQPSNPPAGTEPTVLPKSALKRDAYAKQIAALEKVQASWEKKWPKFAAAMGKVIAEEQKLFAQYRR